ncbi:MAG: lysophospholipid acyltransferase family protein [Bacteroidales bacterium]|nr:lysophospholipid acyltransferase family protein [Bacteroidales bacterium]
MKKFTGFILKILGWKIVGETPSPDQKKLVIVEAPHTSNWDYVYGMLCIMSVGVKVNVIIKKEMFFWPLGPVLKVLGGVPIDRTGTSNKVEAIASLFEKRESLNLAITPEGTRSLSTVWKKGYYYIAQTAGVPIMMTSLDYKKKEGRFGPVFIPSGDYNEDYKKMEEFYEGVHAKFPEKFSLSQHEKTDQ